MATNGHRTWAVASFLAAVLQVTAASADTLVSNLAEPDRDHSAIGNNPNSVPPPLNNDEWSWAAQSFTTDNATYALDDIAAWAGDATTTPVPAAFAELRADDGGTLGALLTTFTVPDLSGPLGARTFIPDTSVVLQPNTTYWFLQGVQVPGDGGYLWTYADTNFSTGTGALAGYAFSSDSGVLWSYGTDFPWKISVQVTPTAGDGDQDGVPDDIDVCPASAPGAIVDSFGRPLGDFDLDCDVDLTDYAVLQINFTGPGI